MYDWIRPALFRLDAERSHELALNALARAGRTTHWLYGRHVPDSPVDVMGLDLPNPIGLAAGLDKNGMAIDGLAGLGFGFMEIGTVTPVAQPGNAQPRLFRLHNEQAIINRMGFNNRGAEALCRQAGASRYGGTLGINIGRNAVTPPERAVDDYVRALNTIYPLASYVTVNISSPNTQGLRDLQAGDALDDLLGRLVAHRDELAQAHGRRAPLAVKVAPDLEWSDLETIAQRLVAHGIDGVIATNTTIRRDGVPDVWQHEAGGLSGAPLRERSSRVIRHLAGLLDGALPIIGAGGIDSGAAAVEKLVSGASAVQLYSGLIYHGPELVRYCAEAVRRYRRGGRG